MHSRRSVCSARAVGGRWEPIGEVGPPNANARAPVRPLSSVGAMVRLQIVGGGKMGEALLGGLWSARDGPSRASWRWSRSSRHRRTELVAAFPACRRRRRARRGGRRHRGGEARRRGRHLPGAGRARHPEAAVDRRRGHHRHAQEAAGPDTAVVRAMPNTPAVVGAGASAIAPGATATDGRPRLGRSPSSTPSGWWCGSPRPSSTRSPGCRAPGPPTCSWSPRASSRPGCSWASPARSPRCSPCRRCWARRELLRSSDEHAAALRGAVTSPGGTTAAGLHALESRRSAGRRPRRRRSRHRALPAARTGLRRG